MRFTFTVEVEVERTEGKFASRDEVAEQITDALDSANPGSVDGIGADGMSTYEVTDWSVEEQPQPKRARRPKLAEAAERSRARTEAAR
jgi:hypothetical protein